MAQTVWPANPNHRQVGPCTQSCRSLLRATCGPAVPTAFSQSSPRGQGLHHAPVRCRPSLSLPATGPRRGAQTGWAGAWLLTPGPALCGQFFVYDACHPPSQRLGPPPGSILPSAGCTEPPACPQPGREAIFVQKGTQLGQEPELGAVWIHSEWKGRMGNEGLQQTRIEWGGNGFSMRKSSRSFIFLSSIKCKVLRKSKDTVSFTITSVNASRSVACAPGV